MEDKKGAVFAALQKLDFVPITQALYAAPLECLPDLRSAITDLLAACGADDVPHALAGCMERVRFAHHGAALIWAAHKVLKVLDLGDVYDAVDFRERTAGRAREPWQAAGDASIWDAAMPYMHRDQPRRAVCLTTVFVDSLAAYRNIYVRLEREGDYAMTPRGFHRVVYTFPAMNERDALKGCVRPGLPGGLVPWRTFHARATMMAAGPDATFLYDSLVYDASHYAPAWDLALDASHVIEAEVKVEVDADSKPPPGPYSYKLPPRMVKQVAIHIRGLMQTVSPATFFGTLSRGLNCDPEAPHVFEALVRMPWPDAARFCLLANKAACFFTGAPLRSNVQYALLPLHERLVALMMKAEALAARAEIMASPVISKRAESFVRWAASPNGFADASVRERRFGGYKRGGWNSTMPVSRAPDGRNWLHHVGARTYLVPEDDGMVVPGGRGGEEPGLASAVKGHVAFLLEHRPGVLTADEGRALVAAVEGAEGATMNALVKAYMQAHAALLKDLDT